MQVTKVGQKISDPLPVICGVPQGSILGPLLFTLYINELPLLLQNFKSNLYADDTAVTVTGCSNEEITSKLERVLDLVSIWFSFNKLSLNYKKTEFMVFGTPQMCRRNTIQSVKFNDESISRADSIKYLGMKLDPCLTFKEHVNLYVKGKTLGKIKLLGKVCLYIRPSTALMLYKSLILPIFDYGDIIYNCISQSDSKTLQVLQNMAFKFILGVPLLTPAVYIHQELEM